jgi:formate hydrogenlyase transcriptional activator
VPITEPIGRADPVPLNGTMSVGLYNPERDRILKALEEARGQVGGPDGAATRLGLKRTTLQSRMRKYDIARLFG